MKTIGIISEFNPFHNGHQYLIEKAKEITQADCVVILCSGNYVQRGMPAFFDKTERTKMALQNGADVVLELPVYYACSSAELFARAGVRILERLNCIDYLCFGCECDNLQALVQIADILTTEPDFFKQSLSKSLKTGASFPKARTKALIDYCKANQLFEETEIKAIMEQSNNILALEYLKALNYFHSPIQPIAIKRIGAGYHSLNTTLKYASATGIRHAFMKNDFDTIQKTIPDNCFSAMKKQRNILLEDFSDILGYQLVKNDSFHEYWEVPSDLSNRIQKLKSDYHGIESFIEQLQTKNYTYSGISRALLHIILNMKKSDIENFINNDYAFGLRLLGFRKDSDILSVISKSSDLDIISKLSTYYHSCDGIKKQMLDISIQSDKLYRMIYMTKYKTNLPTEFERQICIL